MKKPFFSLLGIILLAISSSPTFAATWYVDGGAVSSGDGSCWSQALLHIKDAIDLAEENDEIWVKAGTYTLSQEIIVYKDVYIYGGFNGTEIARIEKDWQKNITTIDGNNAVTCFRLESNGSIDGFFIVNGKDNGVMGNTLKQAIPTIANCVIYNNYWHGIYSYYTALNISNSLIYGNNTSYSDLPYGGAGIYIMNTTSEPSTITDSIIAYNHGSGIGHYHAKSTIVGSIFWGNEGAQLSPYVYGDYPLSVSNSIIEGGYAGGGNIDADPMFIDASNGDYRLNPDSPYYQIGSFTYDFYVPNTNQAVSDSDGDSFLADQDCDDLNPDINPGSFEICNDAKDNDCDGQIDVFDPDCNFCADDNQDGQCDSCIECPAGSDGKDGTTGPEGPQGEQGPAGISPEEIQVLSTQMDELKVENSSLKDTIMVQQQQIDENRYLLEQLPQLKKKIEELEAVDLSN